jgi:hypothetical protein
MHLRVARRRRRCQSAMGFEFSIFFLRVSAKPCHRRVLSRRYDRARSSVSARTAAPIRLAKQPIRIVFASHRYNSQLSCCVTASHGHGARRKTGASEPRASHRIASHHQATRSRTIPPQATQLATQLLRHTVTASERDRSFSAPNSALISLTGHGTKWHSVALNSKTPHFAHSQFPTREKAGRHAAEW